MIGLQQKKYIKGFFDLIRPFTLLAPFIVSSCVIIASFFHNDISGSIIVYLPSIIIASLSLAMLNAASNTLNQITDIDSDKISKPYRPLIKKVVSLFEAKLVSIILYTIALFLSLFINLTFSLIIFIIAMFSITYSLPPRFKKMLFINQIWIAVPRGLFGILASWSVFGNPLDALPITIGFIAMFFLIGGSITKDIIDSDADKKTGTNTLINTYGLKKAALISLPFMIFPFLYIPILINCGLLGLFLWPLTFLAIPAYLVFHLMVMNKKTMNFLENTSSWTLMYCTYFFFAFGFSILTVFC